MLDGGVTAKNHDKVTVKGTFVSGDYAVNFAEVSFYYNGQTWNTSYVTPNPVTYAEIKATGVNPVTKFDAVRKIWLINLTVEGNIPGEIDKTNFDGLEMTVNGKTYPVGVSHSFQHTLFFAIDENILPENCADGSAVTLKAGKAIASDKATGLTLTNDFTIYSFMGSFSSMKPTKDTKFMDITVQRLYDSRPFNKSANTWNLNLKSEENIEFEDGLVFYGFKAYVDGKEVPVSLTAIGKLFFVGYISGDDLPGETRRATVRLKKGTRAYANAGRDGIVLQNDLEVYLFNGTISENEFTETTTTTFRTMGLNQVNYNGDAKRWDLYLRADKELPGSSWYEFYEGFCYYYNGKKITCESCKADSSNGKLYYIALYDIETGGAKEGDTVVIKPGTECISGGFAWRVENEFMARFESGYWHEYYETDIKAPKAPASFWEQGRFAPGYIPLLEEDGGVSFTNGTEYSKITSKEKQKDVTVSFKARKNLEELSIMPTYLILRGNPVDDITPISDTLIYGYLITFSEFEINEQNNSDSSLWGQVGGDVSIWKNGINTALLDQYRISYRQTMKKDYPYFKNGVEYEYTVSCYNIREDVCCIEVSVNGELQLRVYDEASDDPMDPARMEGDTILTASTPVSLYAPVAQLEETLASKNECAVGDTVRVTATYPAVVEGAQFTVEEDGATVEKGVFKAQKAGTYTVQASYNGKKLAPTKITVKEKPVTKTDAKEKNFPFLPVVIAVGSAVLIAGISGTVFLINKKKQKKNS